MEHLKKLRLAENTTQQELAAAVLTRSTLSRLEKGRRPHPKTLRRLSEVLGVRVRTLALLYHHGTLQDRDMATLVLLRGYEPVDLAHVYGWPKVQAFQRKARIWRTKKVGELSPKIG